MRVLWIRPGPSLPLIHGGRVYTYHLVRHLTEFCHVHMLEASRDGESLLTGADAPYGHVIERVCSTNQMPEWSPRRFFTYLWPIVRNFFSREPLCLTVFQDQRLDQRARELAESGRFDVVIGDLFLAGMMEKWNLGRRVPIVIMQHNVEALLWRRVAQLQRNPVTWLFYHEMARRLRYREPELCRKFDAVTAICEADAQHMREDFGLTHVRGVVPIGAAPGPDNVPDAVLDLPARPVIAFVGSMNYQPNTDAALWFINEVFPLIRQTMPDVRFRVIGRNPPSALVREAKTNTAIEVTGTVDEVLPVLRECSIKVVPLRAGGGVRLKIMESLSAGVPIVSTTVGAEGLELENGRDLLIADDAATFAHAVLRLLQDDALRREMAKRGQQRIKTDFSWRKSAASLFDVLKSVTPPASHGPN